MTTYSLEAQTVTLELELTCGISFPKWHIDKHFAIEQELQIDALKKIQTVQVFLPDGCNTIKLFRIGTTSNLTSPHDETKTRYQSLTINQIWVNDILLDREIVKQMSIFYPKYNKHDIEYATAQNEPLPESVQTLDLHYNGTWQFDFESPFFYHYNQSLLNNLSNYNHWVKQSHFGFIKPENIQQLQKIFKKLS